MEKEKLIEAMKAAAPLNLGKAEVLAEKFGVRERSIIATCVKLKIPYEKKQRVAKNGKPPINKTDLVAKIAEVLVIEVGTLEGLEKSSKPALENLLAGIEAVKEEDFDDESDFRPDEKLEDDEEPEEDWVNPMADSE